MNKYVLAAVTAFFIWGFFSIPLRPLQEYSSVSILLFRVVFSILFLIIYVATRTNYLREVKSDWEKLPKTAKKKQAIYIILNGAFLSLNWLSFIYTVNHVSVRATSLAYLIAPILTAFLAVWLLKEKLYTWQWLSILISVFACILLAYDTPFDALAALFVGFTFAIYLVIQKKIFIKRSTPLLLMQLLIALPAILIYVWKQDDGFNFPTEANFYILLVIIAVLFTIIPLLLNIYALKGASSATVGMLININPIIIFLLSVFYWKEVIQTIQVIAFLLIFAAVVLFNHHLLYRKSREKLKPISEISSKK